MNIEDIKAAVDAGKSVHWANTGYVVRKDRLGQYMIVYLPNGSAIGLTNRARTQLNGAEGDFYIAGREAPVQGVTATVSQKKREGDPCGTVPIHK
ncbi:hypothetical protein ROE7235_03727 [Roseibaca ekhonensis]|jgi:hypothetical protein|uniref:Uncharacterized protein n=1 Tax=Roseinatronobacter ekhonensis TaxID=254356 RepID=A0A3B0N1N4_9RHOB|nr:hypothetical protein [Roseibaca ekhonensis]SUZ33946.1 hypothetical protein ROE7235_03727 [Roseibaca ekhonensis]